MEKGMGKGTKSATKSAKKTATKTATKTTKLAVFIPREVVEGETRGAGTPETIKTLIQHGLAVYVETSAGLGASISDQDYMQAGAVIGKDANALYASADIILAANPPTLSQLSSVKAGASWISLGDVHALSPDILSTFLDKKITFFSMHGIPRISKAQSMDALTSQANISGYKAVILAAQELGKVFPLMMTAAGTLHPAKVVVLGAGVAGLQAIATAKRLGAVVEASDVRPTVKEQVESLGAKFIEVPFDKDAEAQGGYAKGASPAFLKRQAEEVGKRIAQADIVICTALVPGKKAPTLVTEAMVQSMRPGSVIVDMAAIQGGNCALTAPGKSIVVHGVKILGVNNIPATVPVHATQVYARNVLAFLLHLLRAGLHAGALKIDLKDEIIAGSLVTHNGKFLRGEQ